MFWGVYAVVSAQYVKGLGSLVEAVNVLGSLFYGGMLGVFVLAFFFRVSAHAGRSSACSPARPSSSRAGISPSIAFLWYNVIGCMVVILTGVVVSSLEPKR